MRTPAARAVRDLVYETFAREGRAPSVAEIARIVHTSPAIALNVLHDLAKAHALVLNEDRDAVRMAHPFSAAPMAFVVTPVDGFDDRRWWGGCAWDSFGISAALGITVLIDTVCPHCGGGIRLEAGPDRAPDGSVAVRFSRPAAQWWDDVVATCSNIRMFCTHDHAGRWTAENAPGTGYIADALTVWRLSGPWYGDRLSPDFQPRTREQNQRLLADVGLTGPFWQLP